MVGIGRERRLRFSVALAALALATTAFSGVSLAAEFSAVVPLAGLTGSNGVRFDGVAASDNAGYALAMVGDVNGDGFDDLAVGARGANSNGDDSGSAYVVFGRRTGFPASLNLALLNGGNGFEIKGASAADALGVSVAGGDVNGDGFADVIVGADHAGPVFGQGSVHVIFGKSSPFTAKVEASLLNGLTGFRLDGVGNTDFTGSSVAGGDINKDGFADVIAGARLANGGAVDSGSAFVLLGKGTPFASAISVTALTGGNGFRLDGGLANEFAGTAVAVLGDVNGDGIGDIGVGATGAGPNGANSGAAYVVFGRTVAFPPVTNLGVLVGSDGFRLDGNNALAQAGSSMSGAGDVNGDGVADILVGSPFANFAGTDGGYAYLVFGRKTAFPAGLALSTLNGVNGVQFQGKDSNGRAGSAVRAAGDVNGDGFADLITGAPGETGGSNEGASYVIFGKAASFGSRVNLSTVNGSNGFKLAGVSLQDYSGFAVTGGGDFNGDGLSDVGTGALGADPAGGYSGSSYVAFGRPPNTSRIRVGSAVGQYISGGAFVDTLSGLGGADDLEGRGGGDVLNGGAGLRDAASYAHAPGAVVADLLSPAGNTGHAAGDSYVAIEDLTGSRFNDVLRGNDAANRLTGGAGRDTQSGRGGPDIFRYLRVSDSPPGAGRDLVTDFNAGTATTAVDRIDVSAIDAKTGPGNDAFSFIGTAPFTNVKGQLRLQVSGTTTLVRGDVNGDGTADIEIALQNFTAIGNLKANDFIK